MCGFFKFICFPRKRKLRKNWMCNSTLLSPGVTEAGTGHAFVLRKFRKDKSKGERPSGTWGMHLEGVDKQRLEALVFWLDTPELAVAISAAEKHLSGAGLWSESESDTGEPQNWGVEIWGWDVCSGLCSATCLIWELMLPSGLPNSEGCMEARMSWEGPLQGLSVE